MSAQPKALELWERLHQVSTVCDHHYSLDREAAEMIRTQHRQIKELCEALGTALHWVDDADFMASGRALLSRIKEQQ